jgi:RNA polymerase sigma-70 factor (ECF subfamily)
MSSEVEAAITRAYREERGRILATLIRVVGDFDAAEEALADAFAAAAAQWPRDGVPDNPRAWLLRAGRNKGVDRLRRGALFEEKRRALGAETEAVQAAPDEELDEGLDQDDGREMTVQDDRLRLIFTCCHPALGTEAQVALTLRTLGGLGTEEIARAFLVPAVTMAQRLVRAKGKIREAGIPYRVPDAEDLPARLDAVLAVIYLIFNEGYAPSAGAAPLRRALCAEAIRLGRLVLELLPGRAEALGLLALMRLHDARGAARVDAAGELVLLEEQDRALWDRTALAEGLALVERALTAGRPPGAYALQAAIAGVHARAARAADTDWHEIAALYRLLAAVHPSPVVALNQAAAVAMADGPEAGLRLIDDLATTGALSGYHLLPAARADLLRRLGRNAEAAVAYREALALAGNDADRRFLERRLTAALAAAT